MTGSTKDPANGPEVAASVFAAVIVYAVSIPRIYDSKASCFASLKLNIMMTTSLFSWDLAEFSLIPTATVFPRLLRIPGLSTCTKQ